MSPAPVPFPTLLPLLVAVPQIDTTTRIAILAGVNLVAYALFRLDKRRAERGQWRIPERTLLLSCMSGGALGGWLAMRTLRHKTRKWRFIAGMVFATAVAVGFWGWLFGVWPNRD